MPKVKFGNDEIHISELSGKLEDFVSISTSPIANPICQKRVTDKNSICYNCFSVNSIKKFRKNLDIPLVKNFQILTTRLFEMDEIPFLNYAVVRFESHGDLANVTQARNYIRIAKKNSRTIFSIWTKNHNFLDKAIALEEKPKNLICGISSPKLNVADFSTAEKYNWCDFLFTVYSADFAIKNSVEMNCPRKCKNCMKCYNPSNFSEKPGFLVINEILKSESDKVKVEGDE